MSVRDEQLDELEALVVSVISGARALRRHGDLGWERSLRRLQVRVAALGGQLEQMEHQHPVRAGARPPTGRLDDDWLPAPAQ